MVIGITTGVPRWCTSSIVRLLAAITSAGIRWRRASDGEDIEEMTTHTFSTRLPGTAGEDRRMGGKCITA